MTFTILAVCTGNICRSPQVENLLRDRAASRRSVDGHEDELRVLSAGTYAMVGDPMDPTAAKMLNEGGSDGADHRAQQLTARLVEDAQLVLCLSREHRKAVVTLVPSANRYAFTLLEFARVVRGLRETVVPLPAPLDFAEWTALASAHRGYFPGVPAEDDVVDPYRRDESVYRGSFDQIRSAVDSILSLT